MSLWVLCAQVICQDIRLALGHMMATNTGKSVAIADMSEILRYIRWFWQVAIILAPFVDTIPVQQSIVRFLLNIRFELGCIQKYACLLF